MANKARINLTKEEIGIIIDAVDLLDNMGGVTFQEYDIKPGELIAGLEEVFYKLKWRDE